MCYLFLINKIQYLSFYQNLMLLKKKIITIGSILDGGNRVLNKLSSI